MPYSSLNILIKEKRLRYLKTVPVLCILILSLTCISFADDTKDISSCTVKDISDVTYMGTEITPEINVYDENGKALIEGADYSVVYEDNINCGTGSAVISGEGEYTGEITKNFKILKAKPGMTGLKKRYNVNAGKDISDEITVTKLYGGEVRLQRYSASDSKWVTVKSYSADGAKDTVKIKYTDYWKKHSITKWRIYIPATSNTESFKSDKVEVTAINISKPALTAKSAVIIRADTKEILYSKNRDKRRKNASTTKLMTALVMLDKGKNKGTIAVSKKAASTPWKHFNIQAGEKFKTKDLYSAMMVASSNEAAVAIAEHTSGSVSKFVSQMNKKAKKMGLKNTHFRSPHGLDKKNHYSSAYDISLMMRKAIKYKSLKKRLNQKSTGFKNLKGKKYSSKSTNRIVGTTGLIAAKTGYTDGAGGCYTGAYRYKGKTYIFTFLGAKSESARWSEAKKMMKYIRENY